MQRYNNLNEELQAQKMFQIQAESTHDAIETESFMRENAQKSEISDLKTRLMEAHKRIATLEMELGYTSSEEIVNAPALNSRLNSQKSIGSSQNFNYDKHLLDQSPNILVKLNDFEERSDISDLEEQGNEIEALKYQINDSNRYLEATNELEVPKRESTQDYLRRDETFQECTDHSSEIPPMLDEIIQQLQAVLSYFQSEVNCNKYIELFNELQSSLYSGFDICEIIRNLLVHFERIRKIHKSLIPTDGRTFSLSPDNNEKNDISSMTTTIGNLRSDLIEIDDDDSTSDLSAIESKNRKIIDQVTLAMAKIQDVVDDSSVRAATEVLTALANGGYGDCKAIAKYDKDRRLPKLLTRTRNRDPSIGTQTDKTCQEEYLDPPRLPSDSDFQVILTRFVDVMARMHILAFDLEANENHIQPQLASSGGIVANSEDGQKSFSEWTQKAHTWFQKFIHGLRNVSLLTEVEADLVSLESEFVSNYSALYANLKILNDRRTLDIIERKCNDLETLNNELESVRAELSNKLEMERQEREKEVGELRSTCDQLKSDLNHSKEMENDLKERLTDTNGYIKNLSGELDKSNEMVTNLQNRLDKSETELSFHQSELHKLKSRAKQLLKIDFTDVQSVQTIFDSFENEIKTQIQIAEQKRKEDEEERICNLKESYESKINDLKNELCKVVEVGHFFAEENLKNGSSREKILISELKAKTAESDHLREGICALQNEVDILRHKCACTKRTVGEELVKRAKKYPELKVIANDLKLRLVKNAELLEHSVAEAKRLRKIIHANDSKSNELLEELERLRAIILTTWFSGDLANAQILCLQCLEGLRYNPRFPHLAACLYYLALCAKDGNSTEYADDVIECLQNKCNANAFKFNLPWPLLESFNGTSKSESCSSLLPNNAY
ncbi:unnamed protein product [Rodentolepis nana]|uniref:DUF5741 domain-containing protein n=1 Tax=Rodentolepis nana TaxID=102285 RepID=A0A0R3TLY6_RODNA|nr:unnamed protein product [Rodentolepis nana]